MLSIVLAATSALVWGAGDFCGGKASQRASALAVTTLAALAGLPLLVLYLVVIGEGAPGAADFAWGAAAGLAEFGGLALFYRALAAGAMSVVAPITAATSAALPLLIGLLVDHPPGTVGLVGAAVAVVAIGLISVRRDVSHDARRSTRWMVGLSLVSGALFGLFFALLGQVSPEAGVWPLLASRPTAAAAGLAAVAVGGISLRLDRAALRWALTAGAFDVIANMFYLYAIHRGILSLVAPVASLYPASTVILALLIDRERTRPTQVVGLVLAGCALALTGL